MAANQKRPRGVGHVLTAGHDPSTCPDCDPHCPVCEGVTPGPAFRYCSARCEMQAGQTAAHAAGYRLRGMVDDALAQLDARDLSPLALNVMAEQLRDGARALDARATVLIARTLEIERHAAGWQPLPGTCDEPCPQGLDYCAAHGCTRAMYRGDA